MSKITQECFGSTLKILTFLGLYPSETSYPTLRTLYKFSVYFILQALTPVLIIVHLTLINENLWQSTEEFQMILYLSGTVGFTIKILPFLFREAKIKECLDFLEQPCFQPQNKQERKIINNCIYICRRNYRVYYYYLLWGGVILWCGSCLFLNKFPFDMWLPFNAEYNSITYYISFFYRSGGTLKKMGNNLRNILALAYNTFSGTTVDLLITGLAYLATGHLKILKYNLRHIAEPSDDYRSIKLDEVYENLQRCVILHQHIIRFVDEYEKCLSWSIFCQFATGIVNLSYSCIGLITASDGAGYMLAIKFIVGVVFVLSQLFLYCYYGTLLYEESDTINTAIYLGPWYNYDVKIRKLLIIVMERSKKPLILTAGKIIDITLVTFGKFLKSSYSLLAVLKNDKA